MAAGRADFILRLCMEAAGKVVGSLDTPLLPPDDGEYFVPVTDWLPALGLTAAKAAFLVSGSNEDFRYKLAIQTAETSVESPGAWAALDTAWHYGDVPVVVVGEQEVTTSDMWARFGVLYSNATGENNNGAQMRCAVAVRK